MTQIKRMRTGITGTRPFFSGKYFDPFYRKVRFISAPSALSKVRADLDHLVLAERIEKTADHHQNTEDDRDSAEAEVNAVADALPSQP